MISHAVIRAVLQPAIIICGDMCGFVGQTKKTGMRHGNYWCDLEWETLQLRRTADDSGAIRSPQLCQVDLRLRSPTFWLRRICRPISCYCQ